MATLSPIEIDIGRKVVSCSHVFRTHLIFLFCSTIMPSPPRLVGFHCPVRIPFCIYGKILLLSHLDICCFSLSNVLNHLQMTVVFIAFTSFSFSKSLSLSLHPTGAIDPSRFREMCKQLTTFFPLSFSTGLSVAIGS